jgi:hypothetical protein
VWLPAQFSKRDADAYPLYEDFLSKVRELVQPILDNHPPNPLEGNLAQRRRSLNTISDLIHVGVKNREAVIPFYELFTGATTALLLLLLLCVYRCCRARLNCVCTVLCCAVLCCAVLCCAVLCCAVLCCAWQRLHHTSWTAGSRARC